MRREKKSLTKKRFEEMKTRRARGGAEADESAFECTKRGRFEWASWLVRMGRWGRCESASEGELSAM